MSWYYTYYIGKKTPEGKLIPVGPYNEKGKLRPVIERSSSFASDLHEDFSRVPDEMATDALNREFRLEDWQGNPSLDVWWLPVSELGSDNFIKTGYFLQEDVQRYQEDQWDRDLFYDRMTPEVYAARLATELKFGPPKEQEDEEGYKFTPHPVSDYMFFAYPDWMSKEYETHLLKQAVDALQVWNEPEGTEMVILMTQG